ncbi:transcriptional regulator, MarR family [Thermoactinomyces sp. DSM 45891]|uniref:MarR family winged helix-turn-helix transcriptional regulator n=1 Tax=Thermoactinomyces sp. DSM 45891 TaxID=1761907 RepID=UPI000912D990|nr:MarR family transcriptional regulator [Thermoactinomyces sp. DSM 45891]SFX19089.1 transcriptional regulator, MarR family [Thermoactinomyces sp. DSM 45891]
MIHFPSKFEDAHQSIGYLFIKVYHLWHRDMKQALKKLDLTHPQFVILTSLGYLSQYNQEVTQVMIAKHSDVDVMTVSTILKNLQKGNLISRTACLTDTRSKVVSLTLQGKRLLDEAVPIVESIDESFFSTLKDKQEDLRLLLLRIALKEGNV